MIKKLFIEVLPLSEDYLDFHELSLALLIGPEIKCAYHYKVSLEGAGYDEQYLFNQGFSIKDIDNNPQVRCEVGTDIFRILDKYINKSIPSDRCILYSYNKDSIKCFLNFMYSQGLYYPSEYFIEEYIELKSLFMDKLFNNEDLITVSYEPQILFSTLGAPCKKDAFSRLSSILKIYLN